ncbi:MULTISPECIES: TonB family protein [unclassified Corallococcus]|uniref:TonB family protein n=1 Tax=unclassified Corallococcus TaxID=2685029 RepID=UPI001A8D2C99|nr:MULTISPECIES: TonB family protein [unclassified Corallococcus]MBN9685141.1 TonB family protein [Corallococcus sp. NCSPR001]WAS83400.1 TonB family protein [Corallococcus sp. NCRR]
MRTILNFDDGLGAAPTLPQAVTARADAVRSPVGLFQSATATADAGWGRWSGALLTATVAHVVAVAVGLMVSTQAPPRVTKPEPELVLMAYAPPPPPLGGGALKQATPQPVKPVVQKPRPKHRELVVPAKVPEPVKELEPVVEQEEPPAATEVAAVASQAPAGPGVPDGAVGGVVGGVVGGIVGGKLGGQGTAPPIYTPREVMKLPALLSGKPEYPRRAREDGITGVVMVMVVIGTDGTVEPGSPRIHRSVPGLDEAALESVAGWRFSPALGHDGAPVRVKVVIPVKFALR